MLRSLPITILICLCTGCSLFQEPGSSVPNTDDDADVSSSTPLDVSEDPKTDKMADLAIDVPSDVDHEMADVEDADSDTDVDAALSPPWWNSDFSSRLAIQISEPQLDRPVRIVIPNTIIASSEWFEDAKDLRFVQNDVSLNYNIERLDDFEVATWVRVPDLMEPVYAYWGNSNAASVRNPDKVWDAHELAFHFTDDRDVTGRGASADAKTGTIDFEPSEFGNAAVFKDAWMRYDELVFINLNFPANTTLLIESRFKLAGTENQALFWKEALCAGWTVTVLNQQLHPSFTNTPTDCADNIYSDLNDGPVTEMKWMTIAVHYDLIAKTMTLYADGQFVATQLIDNTGITGRDGGLRIGSDWQEVMTFDGEIDELHFSRITPTPEYIRFSHKSLSGEAVSFGSVERLP